MGMLENPRFTIVVDLSESAPDCELVKVNERPSSTVRAPFPLLIIAAGGAGGAAGEAGVSGRFGMIGGADGVSGASGATGVAAPVACGVLLPAGCAVSGADAGACCCED